MRCDTADGQHIVTLPSLVAQAIILCSLSKVNGKKIFFLAGSLMPGAPKAMRMAVHPEALSLYGKQRANGYH